MFLAQAARTHSHSRHAVFSGVRLAFRVVGLPRSATLTKLRTAPQLQPHLTQTRPFLSWLLNPKEEPVVPKKLTPLKLEDTGNRLLFWDSTYTTPHLKPEFNGNYTTDYMISGESKRDEREQLNYRLTLLPPQLPRLLPLLCRPHRFIS